MDGAKQRKRRPMLPGGLVLGRKVEEGVVIGEATVTVVEILDSSHRPITWSDNYSVRLHIAAPRDVKIRRTELDPTKE